MVYQLLGSNGTPICVEFWKRKIGIQLVRSHWSIIKNIAESALKTLWWKVVHGVYPTNSTLYKMKISDTYKCTNCDGQLNDDLIHFFVDCPSIKPLWSVIAGDILFLTHKTITLTAEIVILGMNDPKKYTKKEINTINWLIAIGKMVISKFKKGPKRNLMEIYEFECRIRKVRYVDNNGIG